MTTTLTRITLKNNMVVMTGKRVIIIYMHTSAHVHTCDIMYIEISVHVRKDIENVKRSIYVLLVNYQVWWSR